MLSKNEIKLLRALHQKKVRDAQGKLIVEGERILADIVERHAKNVERIIIAKDFKGSRQVYNDFDCVEVDSRTFEQISASKNPQGVLAVLRYPVFRFESSDLILALDGVQDPGNMGTILRTAAWFGVKQIVCSPDSVDVCNPKVVQASMGAVYDVNIVYEGLSIFLSKQNTPIYGALLEGNSIYTEKLTKPAILIMGNEGNGIREEVKNRITNPVMIPKFGTGESLNVATATAILLNEFAR